MKDDTYKALRRLEEESLKPGIGCNSATTICKACWTISLERAYKMGLKDGEENTHEEYRAFEKRCPKSSSIPGFTA